MERNCRKPKAAEPCLPIYIGAGSLTEAAGGGDGTVPPLLVGPFDASSSGLVYEGPPSGGKCFSRGRQRAPAHQLERGLAEAKHRCRICPALTPSSWGQGGLPPTTGSTQANALWCRKWERGLGPQWSNE